MLIGHNRSWWDFLKYTNYVSESDNPYFRLLTDTKNVVLFDIENGHVMSDNIYFFTEVSEKKKKALHELHDMHVDFWNLDIEVRQIPVINFRYSVSSVFSAGLALDLLNFDTDLTLAGDLWEIQWKFPVKNVVKKFRVSKEYFKVGHEFHVLSYLITPWS